LIDARDDDGRRNAPRRFQFGLIGLAELMAGIGLIVAWVAEFAGLGVCLSALGILIVGPLLYVAHARSRQAATKHAIIFGVAVVFALFLIGLMMPMVSRAGPAAYRSTCSNNLRQLALALHGYHDRYGQFPPPYIADANGQPMHSWRVLVLPYMEHQAVYDLYDFSEAWNGPKNRLLATRIFDTFACPSAAAPGATNYFYVAGPGRPGHEGEGLTMGEIADDHGETILLVESDTLAVNWMEPRDLTLDEALRGVNVRPGPSIGSPHYVEERPGRRYYGANVAMVDGSIRFLPERVDSDALRALLTIDGGEEFDWKDVQSLPPDYATVWLPLVGLIYLVVVGWRHLRRSW
jgi:hypothetical protein